MRLTVGDLWQRVEPDRIRHGQHERAVRRLQSRRSRNRAGCRIPESAWVEPSCRHNLTAPVLTFNELSHSPVLENDSSVPPHPVSVRATITRRGTSPQDAQGKAPDVGVVGPFEARERVGQRGTWIPFQLELAQGEELLRLGLAGGGDRLGRATSLRRHSTPIARRRRGPRRRQLPGPARRWRCAPPRRSSSPARMSPRSPTARPRSAPATARTRGTRSRSTAGRPAGPAPPTAAPPGGAGRAAALPPRPASASARAAAMR